MSIQSEGEEILPTEVRGTSERRNNGALNDKTTDVDANEQVESNDKESVDVHVGNCAGGTGGVLPTAHTHALANSVGRGADVDGGSQSPSSKSSAHSGEGRRRGLGGSTTLSLGEFDVVRFRNTYLQVIEELRMRRALNAENEEKIKNLVEERHQLQQKYDEVDLRYHKAVEQCSNHEQEIRAKYSNKLKQIEEEKVRHLHAEESREKEIKGLKDEIRTLQLAKYNVEKKVEEQERQLQLHSTSQESFLSEISQLEQKCQAAMRQGSEIAEQLFHLEANVKQAVELNRRLQYVNEHQKCILGGYKKQLESCRQQLVDARVSLADSQAEISEVGESIGKKTVRTTEQELKMHAELTKQLQLQLGSLREEHQRILLQLKEAHSLIDKHVDNSNKLHSNEELLNVEVGSLKESNEKLLADLTDIQQKLASATEEWTAEKQQWSNKTAEIEQRLRCLQGDYVNLQDSHAKLEAHSSARETELLLQLKETTEREKRRKDNTERERERLIEEWSGRVRQLEESQALPTKSVQHETSKETIQNSAGPILNSSTSLDSIASIVEAQPVHIAVEDQKAAVVPSISPPLSLPHTPVMSPDVISDFTSPSTDKECLTSKEMKLKLPRLLVEKIQLCTQKEPKSTHVALGENSEKNKLSKSLLVPVSYSESKAASSIPPISSFSPSNISSSSVSPPKNNPTSVSPPQIGVSSASPLKRKLDSTEAVDDNTVSKGKSVFKKLKLSEESHDNHNLLPVGYQPVEEDTRSLSQQELVLDRSTFVHLSQSSENKTISSTPEIKEERLSLKSRGHLTDIPWKLEMPKPPAKLCVPRRLDTEDKPVNNLLAQSNENQLHVFGLPAGTQGRTEIVLRQNRCFPSTDSLPAKQLNSDEPPSLNEVPTPGSKHTSSSKITSENNTTISSVKDFGCSESTNRESSVLNMSYQSPSEQILIRKSSPKFDSDGNGGNFAVVFSDGEGEAESGDSLLSSQMSRQINKVHTFLKVDRLRRTRVAKTK